MGENGLNQTLSIVWLKFLNGFSDPKATGTPLTSPSDERHLGIDSGYDTVSGSIREKSVGRLLFGTKNQGFQTLSFTSRYGVNRNLPIMF